MEPVASRELCEDLYILTKCGHKFETGFYYDMFGHVWTREAVQKRSKRYLPPEFLPAFTMGFVRKLILDNVKHPERIKSKLKTALVLGEDEVVKLAIQMWQQNHFNK